ncbi:MAG: hypothetical protein M1358_23825 [Chloroflexi bacterium]|nr:hypothetical protein [Chloroflexota bacterium]
MVSLVTGNDLVLLRISGLKLELPGHLNGRFRRFRPAAEEFDRRETRRRDLKQQVRQSQSHIVGGV